jgi:hypothetical protein
MNTPAAAPPPAWTLERPWRNNNPGDLRCLAAGQKWNGQTGIDNAPGGPFAIFDSRTMGWRALAVCLLTYFEKDGCYTVERIIDRYAPPGDNNNTPGYVALVCGQIGVQPNGPVNPHSPPTMLAMVGAIALAEGSARIQWPAAEKLAGIQLALGIAQATKVPT